MKLCPVILCGGTGTRLWPLSRRLYPKQFMDLGGHTLFGDTLKRIGVLPDLTPPLVICNKEQRFLAAAQMQEQGLDPTGRVILEPEGRNTAPAIAVAALAALEQNRGGDVLLLVLPSDHVIREDGAFARAVAQAAACAGQGRLVTFGIEPGGPETGYGYIQRGEALATGFAVRRFVEKPRRDAAEAMLAEGGYYWNSGMFLFRASLFLDELRHYASDMFHGAAAAWEGRAEERDFTWLGEAFAACPADSIDYAVMEKTPLAAVVPLDAGWNDLGSWNSVYDAASKDAAANVLVGDVLAEDVSGSYLHSSGRLVAALGVRDLVVVETGDAVLVTSKDRSQEVKNLVARLTRHGRSEKDTHLRVFRPWGWYETLALGERFQVKRIMVKSGASLSLQLHHQRAEHWVVVSGVGRITVGENLLELHADQSTYIPLGVRHRLANAGPQPLEIIEIQSGSYLGEDDIVRFEDTYGRC
ncbi:mannose-1-phosphate guanylyltransferase/mannose-6-phosphate isomerase [Desulfovibrio porci]|uniref:mannose-1-phosphate guanylyltransferase/mannose-6-phosphate isomerase n=1 Tax=Desulfovibrio porci TaxID=2605782 RepID=UPI002A83DC95|nr:mannose-1-phosphate guanylyltransferase/mannose-6-phosphate isomerase [Desulfovibrio porci]MDY3811013.1 mannose-1-phosphate guanylyltransferase/mannose-6-phosphate isomerase [Desulfovibrio porci]